MQSLLLLLVGQPAAKGGLETHHAQCYRVKTQQWFELGQLVGLCLLHPMQLVTRCPVPLVQKLSTSSLPALPPPALTTSAYFDGLGRVPTPVYMLDDLVGGQQLDGPTLLIDNIRWLVCVLGLCQRQRMYNAFHTEPMLQAADTQPV